MPNTTDGLPYPSGSDPFDVPQDIQDLAEAVDGTYYTKTEVDANTYSKTQADGRFPNVGISGASNIHFGGTRVTPNANGKAVIAHGAPFQPTKIVCFITDDAAAMDNAGGRVINVESDTGIGTENFTARIYRNDNGNPSSSPLNVRWICWEE